MFETFPANVATQDTGSATAVEVQEVAAHGETRFVVVKRIGLASRVKADGSFTARVEFVGQHIGRPDRYIVPINSGDGEATDTGPRQIEIISQSGAMASMDEAIEWIEDYRS